MEVVILDDMVATFNTTWVRIANTTGAEQIKVGDEFQEAGALEEFKVEATSFSPVPGASRLRLLRAHHSTKAEVHKAGGVLRQIGQTLVIGPGAPPIFLDSLNYNASDAINVTDNPTNGSASAVENPSEAVASESLVPDTILVSGTEYPNPAKRGRGRPPGAKNKPKQVPAWPGV